MNIYRPRGISVFPVIEPGRFFGCEIRKKRRLRFACVSVGEFEPVINRNVAQLYLDCVLTYFCVVE